ncbi:ATP-binding protein [Streptomyces sp. NPDC048362]|uniref:ATP-binding protein n=1 Tax=Streptomyces sp. NPDC048362 TaxID=3365539 RepID=UPI00371B5C1A
MLDREIAARCIPPVIVVVPTDSDPGHDGECVDAVGGRRNDTYLAVDVPAELAARYRVSHAPRSWAAMGYSTGGFCAVNAAFHHPSRYAAAAALSGYFTPVTDASTGDLYRGRHGVRQWNSPQWQAAHRHIEVPLYVVAGRADPEAQRAIEHLNAAARGRVPITTGESPAGGHNFTVWSKACPAAFDWLAGHLPVSAPSLAPPSQVVTVEQLDHREAAAGSSRRHIYGREVDQRVARDAGDGTGQPNVLDLSVRRRGGRPVDTAGAGRHGDGRQPAEQVVERGVETELAVDDIRRQDSPRHHQQQQAPEPQHQRPARRPAVPHHHRHGDQRDRERAQQTQERPAGQRHHPGDAERPGSDHGSVTAGCWTAFSLGVPGGRARPAAMVAGYRSVRATTMGPGFPPAFLPLAFERFRRADAARARAGGGAGLGLAIVRSIAEAHGGSVVADNPEGGGARVRLEVPLAPGPPA